MSKETVFYSIMVLGFIFVGTLFRLAWREHHGDRRRESDEECCQSLRESGISETRIKSILEQSKGIYYPAPEPRISQKKLKYSVRRDSCI